MDNLRHGFDSPFDFSWFSAPGRNLQRGDDLRDMGRLRILHWGPLLALFVIGVISGCTVMCDMQWWPPNTPGGIINLLVYAFWNIATLYNFFSARYGGPGYVNFGWKPVSLFKFSLIFNYHECAVCYKLL